MLRVSRATVRKVVSEPQDRVQAMSGVQLAPKLGAWVEVLAQILEKEAASAARNAGRRSACSKSCEAAVTMARSDSVHRFTKSWRDEQARTPAHAFVPPELCARRSLPVRLEPREPSRRRVCCWSSRRRT